MGRGPFLVWKSGWELLECFRCFMYGEKSLTSFSSPLENNGDSTCKLIIRGGNIAKNGINYQDGLRSYLQLTGKRTRFDQASGNNSQWKMEGHSFFTFFPSKS